MTEPVRVKFTDFPPNAQSDGQLLEIVRKRFPAVISDDPEILFYAAQGEEYRRYNCLRIFYTGENVRPNFDECDFAFAFDYIDDPRMFRLPFCSRFTVLESLTDRRDPATITAEKTRFCNFVYSNPHPRERIRFFRLLSRYRRVDSFGRVLNNMPFEPHAGERFANDYRDHKAAFLKPYKFTISFESESYPGYVTEKIIDPMRLDSIPIYWGSPRIHEDFNSRSFVNCHEFGSLEEVVERIIEIDRDPALYHAMLAEPWLPGNRVPERLSYGALTARLHDIVARRHEIVPVAQQPDAIARARGVSSPREIMRSRYSPRQRRIRTARYIRWPAFRNRVHRAAAALLRGDWRWVRERLGRRRAS